MRSVVRAHFSFWNTYGSWRRIEFDVRLDISRTQLENQIAPAQASSSTAVATPPQLWHSGKREKISVVECPAQASPVSSVGQQLPLTG